MVIKYDEIILKLFFFPFLLFPPQQTNIWNSSMLIIITQFIPKNRQRDFLLAKYLLIILYISLLLIHRLKSVPLFHYSVMCGFGTYTIKIHMLMWFQRPFLISSVKSLIIIKLKKDFSRIILRVEAEKKIKKVYNVGIWWILADN
jgi:hypothetical protein